MKDTLKAAWNHGGSMFATFWIVIALYVLGGYLVWAFLQLDAQFSRPLAGDVIPANVTQQIAWGTRAFSVIAGSMAIYFHVKEMPSWRRIFSILTGVAAIILLLHAYGISAKIMQGQFDSASAQVATVAAVTTSIEDQISDVEDELDQAKTSLEMALQVAQETIEGVRDPVAGFSVADNQTIQQANDDKAEALATYNAEVQRLNQKKRDLRTDKATSEGNETQTEADSDSFNPLFVFGARLSTWEWDPAKDPSDVHKFAWGVAFFTLFFGFGEILMMVAFTGGYAALKVVSEREAAKDPVRVAAGKKGAKTKARRKRQTDKIEEQAESYLPRWKHALRLAKNTKYTAKGIAETAFKQGDMEHAITIMKRAGLITDEEIRLVKRMDENLPVVTNPNAVDVINPDPSTTNGSGQPVEGENDADDDSERAAAS